MGQELVDLGPQGPAGSPLVIRQGFDCRLVADAGQVGVGLPVLESLAHQGLGLRLAGVGLLGPESQIGLEPIEGLLPPAGFLLFIS